MSEPSDMKQNLVKGFISVSLTWQLQGVCVPHNCLSHEQPLLVLMCHRYSTSAEQERLHIAWYQYCLTIDPTHSQNVNNKAPKLLSQGY